MKFCSSQITLFVNGILLLFSGVGCHAKNREAFLNSMGSSPNSEVAQAGYYVRTIYSVHDSVQTEFIEAFKQPWKLCFGVVVFIDQASPGAGSRSSAPLRGIWPTNRPGGCASYTGASTRIEIGTVRFLPSSPALEVFDGNGLYSKYEEVSSLQAVYIAPRTDTNNSEIIPSASASGTISNGQQVVAFPAAIAGYTRKTNSWTLLDLCKRHQCHLVFDPAILQNKQGRAPFYLQPLDNNGQKL